MKILNIQVEGMNCGSCVSKITDHFKKTKTISNTEVNLKDQTIKITGEDDLSNMKLRNDLIELGFTVTSIKRL